MVCLLLVAQTTREEDSNASIVDSSHGWADAETSETPSMKFAMNWDTWPNIIDPGLILGVRRHGTMRRACAPALLLGHLTRFV